MIDDEESLLKLLKLQLEKAQHEITTASTAMKGLETFISHDFDAVLCDIGLPDMEGTELLVKLKEARSITPIIMITAHGSIDSAIKAMKIGAYDYIQKPFEIEEIEFVLQRAVRETQLQVDYSRLRSQVESEYDFSKIIGQSKKMKALFSKMRKAAETKSTVLITGPSGTGKELIARAIHFNSPRKKKPIVVVDCGAIPGNLLESELFGHVKGAFTGADTQKKGLCEEADGGTLFLDEIGEMPIELQTKLLRLLQESTIRRVGETKPIQIDIRVVAATNKNLPEEIKNKNFREDLFYRLNVLPLESPALKDREDDAIMLAQHFLKKYAGEYQRETEAFAPNVLARFRDYDWPGNVRQLENVVEQMLVMSETKTKTLELDSVPPPLNTTQSLDPAPLPDNEWNLKKALADVQAYTEECMIRKALEKTSYNKTKAAELLGISRRSIISKAQEYKLEAASDEA